MRRRSRDEAKERKTANECGRKSVQKGEGVSGKNGVPNDKGESRSGRTEGRKEEGGGRM